MQRPLNAELRRQSKDDDRTSDSGPAVFHLIDELCVVS
jgi:hypothetical protein